MIYKVPVSIRRKRPDDFDRIIVEARRKAQACDIWEGAARYAYDAMPKAGVPPITDDNDNTDADEIVGKLLSYLERYLEPEQMEGVKSILASGDDDGDTSGARQPQATDRRVARLAVDAQRRRMGRQMSAADEATYAEMFPNMGRLG